MSDAISAIALPSVNGVSFAWIPFSVGYCAGSDGTIWSCRATGRLHRLTNQWHQLKQSVNSRGYKRVTLVNDKHKPRGKSVAVLVLQAFQGVQNLDSCHNDGDKLNNSIDNLRWDTRLGNIRDKVIHGTTLSHERHPRARLNQDDVHEIRCLYRSGVPSSDIAARFKITQRHVERIHTRSRWK